jgi:hypothetical protein
MVHASLPSVRRARRHWRLLPTVALVAVSLAPAFFLAGRPGSDGTSVAVTPVRQVESPPAADPAVGAPTRHVDNHSVDHGLVLKPEALGLSRDLPLQEAFWSPALQASDVAEPPVPMNVEPATPPEPPVTIVSAAELVPLPVPRPADLRPQASKMAEAPPAALPLSRPMKRAAAPAAPVSNPSFFERLFGVKPVPEAALSYAALDPNLGGAASGSRLGLDPRPASGPATAIYDITARVVHLPNGERLEAHSGLGDKLDDPRYVHVRMRGATPPGTYDLTERERLFHGVRALRLNPVGGSGSIHGRDGLLAHTFMLGPNGDSNGCVSFRNYDRFLQAYLRGEIRRLVVVAGRGQDALPRFASSRD